MPATRQGEWVDRGWYLVTEFGRSPASDFSDAVEYARGLPGYVELLDENLHAIHRNTLRAEDLCDRVWSLLNIIENWQSAKAFVRGDEVPVWQLMHRLYCFRAGRRAARCDVGSRKVPTYFGCPRSGIGLWPTADNLWYGRARHDGGRFVIPVEELASGLKQRLAHWAICPLLDLRKALRLVGRLPKVIDPSTDTRWRLKKSAWLGEAPTLCPASADDYFHFLTEHLFSPERGEGDA